MRQFLTKNANCFVLALGAAAALCACGGEEHHGTVSASLASNPMMSVSSNFDLSNASINTVLQSCASPATQLVLIKNGLNVQTQKSTKYSFYVDGSFSFSGAASCATTSVSGRISGLRLTADDQPVYTITGIDIPAAAIQSDYKTLWTALIDPAAEVLASSQTALTISCTDGAGQSQSINVLSPSGIGAFLTKCLQ